MSLLPLQYWKQLSYDIETYSMEINPQSESSGSPHCKNSFPGCVLFNLGQGMYFNKKTILLLGLQICIYIFWESYENMVYAPYCTIAG